MRPNPHLDRWYQDPQIFTAQWTSKGKSHDNSLLEITYQEIDACQATKSKLPDWAPKPDPLPIKVAGGGATLQ